MSSEFEKIQKAVKYIYETDVVINKESMAKDIHLAIDYGYEILKKKQQRKDNMIFSLIAMTIFAMAGFVIQLGFISILIGLQLVLIIGVPFFIPYSINHYFKGGLR